MLQGGEIGGREEGRVARVIAGKWLLLKLLAGGCRVWGLIRALPYVRDTEALVKSTLMERKQREQKR